MRLHPFDTVSFPLHLQHYSNRQSVRCPLFCYPAKPAHPGSVRTQVRASVIPLFTTYLERLMFSLAHHFLNTEHPSFFLDVLFGCAVHTHLLLWDKVENRCEVAGQVTRVRGSRYSGQKSMEARLSSCR